MASEHATAKETKYNWNRARAMEHPVRAQALRLLVERGKMSPKEIAETINELTPTVSYHCRQLVVYDCAEMVEERRVEGKGALEHFYIATERHLLDAAEWDEIDPLAGEGFLHEIMRMIIGDYEASRAAKIVGSDSDFHLTRTPQILDEQGVKESIENSERWRLEQSEIEARSAARRGESGESGIPVSSSLVFFKMPTS